jgi:hypothetical protein
VLRDLTVRAAVVGDAVRELAFRTQHPCRGVAHTKPVATPDAIDRTIALGVEFLARAQRSDGSWTDFLLLPGASVEWITAHVAFVLEAVPKARELTARAAQYLASVGPHNGGWGYNRRVANDCDSTAQALLVLQAQGMVPPSFIVDWLISTQDIGGGFPTYASPGASAKNGWQVAHPEVTAIVVEALRRLGVADDRRHRALDWLDRATTGRLIQSYWWPSPAYAAWAQVRTGFRAEAAAQHATQLLDGSRSSPQLPMLLAAASGATQFAPARCRSGLAALLAQQLSDGSWPCDPCLQVPSPARFQIGESVLLEGRTYPGTRRVLSTAHAVAALQSVVAALTAKIVGHSFSARP